MQCGIVERAGVCGGGPRPNLEFLPQHSVTEKRTGQVRKWWSQAVICEVAVVSSWPRGLSGGLALMVVKLVEKHNGIEYIPVTPHTLPFQDDIPGPGFYNVIHQSPVSNSVSLSKKGTCTFPSVVRTPSLKYGH